MSNDTDKKHNFLNHLSVNTKEYQQKISDISIGIFFIAFIASLSGIGYEVFVWLKNGEWLHLQFFVVFDWLKVDVFSFMEKIEWQGLKKIMVWYLELPLSLGLVATGAVLATVFYSIFNKNN